MVVLSAFPVNASPLLDTGDFADCRIVFVDANAPADDVNASSALQLPASSPAKAPANPGRSAPPSPGPRLATGVARNILSPKPKIWLGQFPQPATSRTGAGVEAPSRPAGPQPLLVVPGHRVVLAAASPLFRQQLATQADAIIRLRDRTSLPAAQQLLLAHVYGRPLDWPALTPTTLAQLLVLSADHALPALQQAAAARLLHLLAAKRPVGGPGPAVAAAAAGVNTPLQRPPCGPSPLEGGAGTALPAPPPAAAAPPAGAAAVVCTALQEVHSVYVEAIAAVVGLPTDVAGAGACVGLAAAARVLLLDALQDFEAAWQVPSLRRAFLGLPLPAALEVLASPALAVSCEGVVALAALAYEATRTQRAVEAAAAAAGEAGAADGGGGGGVGDGGGVLRPLDTCEQLALYGCVRWHLLHIDGRTHEWNSFLKNAVQRAPHLQRLLEHGTAASGTGGAVAAATGGVGLAPHAAAVPELAAAAAACGPYAAAASLLDLSQLTQSLLYTRQMRAEGGTGAAAHLPYMARRAGPRPRPTGHLQTAVHLQMDVPYVVLREAVARVQARMEQQERQRRLLERQQQQQQQHTKGGGGGGGVPAATAAALPLAVAPVAAVAVEEDLVGSELVFHAGYWWQMVVSLGPLCRYRMALAGPSAAAPPASGSAAVARNTPSALAAAAAAVAHDTDTRLVCFVGVRPLLLLTEAEVEAAAGRGVPSGWAGEGGCGGEGEGGEADGVAAVAAGAAVAARLLPSTVYVEQFEVWNERDLPQGRAALGPTAFARAGGFKGTLTLFALGAAALTSEAYWAKAVSGPEGALRVRARVAGVH